VRGGNPPPPPPPSPSPPRGKRPGRGVHIYTYTRTYSWNLEKKRSEMDPNVKHEALSWYFWPRQPPILSWSICSSHNLVNLNILCQQAQLNVASALWRNWKLLYEAPWPTRDCNSALHKHKDIDWYRLRSNRVCPSEGYMSLPLLVN